jgi:large subunit ribosomal protein L4
MSRGAPIVKERTAPVARQVTRRDVSGKELGTVDLAPEIFGIEPNAAVLHQVVTAQLAAARSGTQSTLTRAEVRGGGAKPYRQKGTGRARQGSRTAPHFVGGGKAFGPKPRSYRQHTPKKMVRLALHSALSDRAASERVALVDAFGWETPRTKDAVAALAALELGDRVLVVLGPDDVVAERSFGNLPAVQTVLLGELAAHDIVRNEWVLFTDETLGAVSGEVRADAHADVDAEATTVTSEATEAAETAEAETETDEATIDEGEA